MRVSATTRVIALLGRPVMHSLSPVMHNAAFRALGLDAVYVALDVDTAEVHGLLRGLVLANGAGNVTAPHKAAAAAAVDRMTGPVPAACNCFWRADDGQSVGDNTDVAGVLHALDALGAPADAWLVIGTGGSSDAVVEAARQRGARLAFRSRAPDRAVAAGVRARGAGVGAAAEAACRVVINTTPLGRSPEDPSPVAPEALPPAGGWALDLVYTRRRTAWIRSLRERGWQAEDGREVLLGQGFESFRRWFPAVDPPREVMRAALAAALVG